jgi:hypothetical protein
MITSVDGTRERKDIRDFIETHHYSKNVNGVKVTLCLKATYNSTIVGAMLFGQMSTTAWKKFGATENEVLELRRLVLLDDVERNGESFFIGWAIRYIKKNLKAVKRLVSYADPMFGHTGVVYKATNFKYIGKSGTDKGYLDTETGKVYHSRALRTRYNGEYKPFVQKLRDKHSAGLLKEIKLQGKYCYLLNLS